METLIAVLLVIMIAFGIIILIVDVLIDIFKILCEMPMIIKVLLLLLTIFVPYFLYKKAKNINMHPRTTLGTRNYSKELSWKNKF